MQSLIILAILVLAPFAVIMLLRVNAAIAFMSLCLGSVLVTYTSADVTDLLTSTTANGTLRISQWVKLALLLAPLLFTIVFMRKSIPAKKRFINAIPAVASGLLVALLATPLLSGNVQAAIRQQQAWQQLSNLQTPVVLAGAFFSLLFLLMTNRGHHGDEEKHSKK